MPTVKTRLAYLGLCGKRRYAVVVSVLIWLILAGAPVPAGAEDVVVGVHISPVEKASFSRSALQAVFGMRLHTWPDGSAITVFVLPDNHPAHIAFCKQVLHVFPHEMRSAWDRLVFSGTGQAPLEVESEEAMRAKIAGTPGAIGYLSKTLSDGTIAVMPIE